MPVVKTRNVYLSSLSGVHIWHADMSSCSQRVRIALAEKGIAYKGHLIDLQAGENASEAYQEIHPKGLVPAMVIDGELFVESIDIIDEIDRLGNAPSLRPVDPFAVVEMETLMARADEAQSALKLLTFEFLFSAAPPPSLESFQAFQSKHKNESLKAFFRDFAQGFERDRIAKAVSESHEDFRALETYLSDGRPFLAGAAFSLADIAWIPNVHRYDLFGWPFEDCPNLMAWFVRMKARPSYNIGLVDWEPAGFTQRIMSNITARIEAGDGVASYIRRYD